MALGIAKEEEEEEEDVVVAAAAAEAASKCRAGKNPISKERGSSLKKKKKGENSLSQSPVAFKVTSYSTPKKKGLTHIFTYFSPWIKK